MDHALEELVAAGQAPGEPEGTPAPSEGGEVTENPDPSQTPSDMELFPTGDDKGEADRMPSEVDGGQDAPKGARANDADRPFERPISGEAHSVEPQEDEAILTLEEPVEEETDPFSEAAGLEAGETMPDIDREAPEQESDLNGGTITGGGLSDEERGDLEKLIKGLNDESLSGTSAAVVKRLQKQVKATQKRVVELNKMLLAYDRKLKSCYEIMRLHHEKAEIMNRRIDAVVEAMNNGKPV